MPKEVCTNLALGNHIENIYENERAFQGKANIIFNTMEVQTTQTCAMLICKEESSTYEVLMEQKQRMFDLPKEHGSGGSRDQKKDDGGGSIMLMPLLIPDKNGEHKSCLPSTKTMNDDSPSKYTVVSSGVNATTPANKWSPSTTVLTNSTIPFSELKLLPNNTVSIMALNNDDDSLFVDSSINESSKNRFVEDDKEGTTKSSSLELEIDLQAVKGIMGRSIIVKDLDIEPPSLPKQISSATLVDKGSGATLTSSLQQQRNDTHHPSIIASSKLPEFLEQKRRTSYSGKVSSSSPGLGFVLDKRRASYGGAKRSFVVKKMQENMNGKNTVHCSIENNINDPIKAEVVEYRNDGIVLLEEAMEEVIIELTSTTKSVEDLLAERDLNEDILFNILNRIVQLESSIKIKRREEEEPMMTTEDSSQTNNTSVLHQTYQKNEENIKGGGGKEWNVMTMDDIRDMMEKISDSHRKEIDDVKQMFVVRNAFIDKQLNELETKNQEIKKRLKDNTLYLPEADITQVTKKNHDTVVEGGCKCLIQ